MAKKGLNAWQKRQAKDLYVQEAKKQGYRSRAAFKLIEIQDKKTLFHPGMHILELGAAPGGWSQLIAEWIAPHGYLYAIDLLAMHPIPGVKQHLFDIESEAFNHWLENTFRNPEHTLDWVVSDMAPNMSGHQTTDQLRSIGLCETVLGIAQSHAAQGSGLLIKAFQGIGIQELSLEIKNTYRHFSTLKPKASERSNREVYLLGLDKR